LHIIDSHTSFTIGALEVHPYPVPHDAREPVQYVLSDGARRLGVLTDAGAGTPHIEAMLSACEALVLECNHDLELLENGNYPWPLKQRIRSRLGHLDNACAAGILSRLDNRRLQHLVAAHLSTQNNRPQLARQALAGALDCTENWIGIADQDSGFDWRQIA
jgi:phosphoribosyl 1,2-cyclic phosphodiesterase